MEPQRSVRNLPRYASDTKAPANGVRLQEPDQTLNTLTTRSPSILYWVCRYTVRLAIKPIEASFSKDSFPGKNKANPNQNTSKDTKPIIRSLNLGYSLFTQNVFYGSPSSSSLLRRRIKWRRRSSKGCLPRRKRKRRRSRSNDHVFHLRFCFGFCVRLLFLLN